MAQLLRRRLDDDATDFDTDWDSANVGYAIAVSIGAGLATGLGGALVFFPKFFKSIPQSIVLGVSLAHWDELKPTDERCLTQLGGLVAVDADGRTLYEWRDGGICHVADFEALCEALPAVARE